MGTEREFLRHTLATLAYRAQKVLRNAPSDFGAIRACATCRSAVEILAHLSDLLDWALTTVRGQPAWNGSRPGEWPAELGRFNRALNSLDEYLASDLPLQCDAAKLFQGPMADALTHVGQLATLRRLAGSAVRGENYVQADIVPGRLSPEQTPPAREFD